MDPVGVHLSKQMSKLSLGAFVQKVTCIMLPH